MITLKFVKIGSSIKCYSSKKYRFAKGELELVLNKTFKRVMSNLTELDSFENNFWHITKIKQEKTNPEYITGEDRTI